MRPNSDHQNKLIDWLNTLIMMAQWDKTLPLYFARLFADRDKYDAALRMIREASYDGNPPSLGGALDDEEWRRVYRTTTRAESLRKLFAEDADPFSGGRAAEISVLADVSDLTTDAQTLFYSQNGTFQIVLEAVRQRPELDTVELITDGLHKFYMLLDKNESIAEDLYELAGSNDWYLVLASLYDVRDYTTDETQKAKQRLDQWNLKLTTELRSILFKPTKLYRVPKRLVRLAWEQRHLFAEARGRLVLGSPRPTDFEIQQQVANIAYPSFAQNAKTELSEIESDLQLLATVARHFISVRKFAKLDGLVYAWPRIASLAMTNYANLEYVEDFFVERKPRPTDEELDARDAGELYELCASNSGLIRFLRLRPYFKEIDENELRRYRPLAPVTISTTPIQQPQATIPPPTAPTGAQTPGPVTTTTSPTRVCELRIVTSLSRPENYASEDFEYEISLTVGSGETVTKKTTFSITKLLEAMHYGVGATSEDSLQSVMKSHFAAGNAEQILVRAGNQLLNAIIYQTALNEPLVEAFRGDGPVRLIIRCELEELQYLPWEWLPRPGYNELLLSNPRFSMVRTRPSLPTRPAPLLGLPIRIMGLFPNVPVGRREISESAINSMASLASDKFHYLALAGEEANLIRVDDELHRLLPQLVHFEGYIGSIETDDAPFFILSASPEKAIEMVHISRFAGSLTKYNTQLLVAGRNESSRIFNNVAARAGYRLLRYEVPAILVAIRAIDEVTSTSFSAEFYRAFISGSSLEQALHTARRKVASRGGDWTPFALFANPDVLDLFQPLPPTA